MLTLLTNLQYTLSIKGKLISECKSPIIRLSLLCLDVRKYISFNSAVPLLKFCVPKPILKNGQEKTPHRKKKKNLAKLFLH